MARDHHLITGLDVGTTKVCAIIAEIGQGGRPNVLGVGLSPCTGLKKGIVVDLESTTSAIRKAMEEAEQMAGYEVQSVLLGVTGEHIACLNNRSTVAITHPGHEIAESDIERLLDSARVIVLPPDREIIHAIPRGYSVDGQSGIHSPLGMYGSRLEVEAHIVTGLSSFIQNVVKCVHQAGWTVAGTVLEPIATGESVLLPAEKDLGVCVVDIGGGTSDVAIYVDGEIYYSGVIPVGGNHVTRDIAIGVRSSIEDAEQIKREYGCASIRGSEKLGNFEVRNVEGRKPRELPVKVLAEIIEPRAVEICHLVLDQIEKAGCEDRLPAGLVLTGGGSQLTGFADLACEVTGMAVRTASPQGVDGMADAVQNPSHATAVGLVLYYNRNHVDHASNGHGQGILPSLLESLRGLIAKFADFR
jgi:cell division protein FtsA